MYDFSYILTSEEIMHKIRLQVKSGAVNKQQGSGGKKKKEGIAGRLFGAWCMLGMMVLFFGRITRVYGRGIAFAVLFLTLMLLGLLNEEIQCRLQYFLTMRRIKKSGMSQRVRLVLTEQMVTLETEAGTQYFSWSRFRYMNSFGDIAVLGGDRVGIYLPVRAVGTAEDLAELKRFTRECIEKGRHGTLDIQAFRKEYEGKAAYCYCFFRTLEEVAEECAEMTPRALVSKAYWNRIVAIRWGVALILTSFFCGLTQSRTVFIAAGCLYLLFGAGMVYESGFEARKKRLLSNHGGRLNKGLAGQCLFAFDEEGIRVVQSDIAGTYAWKRIRRVKKGRSCLGFLVGTNAHLLLPEKVFEGEDAEKRLLEYCERRIKQGKEE